MTVFRRIYCQLFFTEKFDFLRRIRVFFLYMIKFLCRRKYIYYCRADLLGSCSNAVLMFFYAAVPAHTSQTFRGKNRINTRFRQIYICLQIFLVECTDGHFFIFPCPETIFTVFIKISLFAKSRAYFYVFQCFQYGLT